MSDNTPTIVLNAHDWHDLSRIADYIEDGDTLVIVVNGRRINATVTEVQKVTP